MTETSPMISLTDPNDITIGSVGKLLENVEIKFTDNKEILVKGPNVFQGYYGQNTNQIDWFSTGDTGYMKNNKLYLTGRIKEEYKLHNGKYVNPSHIENLLLQHPIFNQVLVYGNNRPYNIVLVSLNSKMTEKECGKIIYELCIKNNVESYEIPRKVHILKEEFSVVNGCLTQKLSMKRNIIEEKYKSIIESLYL